MFVFYKKNHLKKKNKVTGFWLIFRGLTKSQINLGFFTVSHQINSFIFVKTRYSLDHQLPFNLYYIEF